MHNTHNSFMTQDQSIQSLDRGLAIMRYIAAKGSVTASEVAIAIGVHQSSASRLLSSLLKAGFVKKPTFHSFSLDYGSLEFAGLSLNSLPAVQSSYKLCNAITNQTGLNVAVGMLRNNKVLYLTQNDIEMGHGLRFLSSTDIPLHRSSLGGVMSWALGKRSGLALLKKSYADCSEQDGSKALYQSIQESMDRSDLFWFTEQEGVKFNASIPLKLDGELAAVAVYSRTKDVSIVKVQKILHECRDILLSEQ